MTQSDEVPGQPVPAQPTEPAQAAESVQATEAAQATELIQVAEQAQATEPAQAVQPTGPAQAAAPAQFAAPAQAAEPAQFAAPAPAAEPAQATENAQPAQFAAPAQPAQPFAAPAPTATDPMYAATQAGYPLGGAPAGFPMLDPEAQAAAAAKKAKRRGIFVKSVVLAVPAVVLIALLAATSIKAGALSTKTNDASTAAKSATTAGKLSTQLHAAQSAAEASILVDPGCVAIESQATQKLGDALVADGNSLDKAASGTSFAAFSAAANHYINDLQALSTDLQQDAALSKRASLNTAVGAVTGDLKVLISSMQALLGGDISTSTENKFDAAANRMNGDATAVDTMCGGSILDGTSDSTLGDSLSA